MTNAPDIPPATDPSRTGHGAVYAGLRAAVVLLALALSACGGTPSTPGAVPAPTTERSATPSEARPPEATPSEASAPQATPPEATASATTATTEVRTPVERMLEASDVGSLVDARARSFTRQVALLAGDLTDAELERLVPAVREGFDATRLRADIASFVEEEAPPGRIDEVLVWLEGGRSAEAHRIVDAYDPPLDLREWLAEPTTDPPSPPRIQLVARWTAARGTGDFYVLLDQALDEAAHAVRRSFRPEARRFAALEGEELLDRLEASFNAAVVAELHRSETVPDSVISGSTREFESDAGVWYVQSYQLAVARAMREAGARVVDALAR